MGVVYAGTAASVQNRERWKELGGIQPGGLLNSTVLSLLQVPFHEQFLFAGTMDGIFESKGGGVRIHGHHRNDE